MGKLFNAYVSAYKMYTKEWNEFLEVAGIDKGVSKAFDTLPYCNPEKTAKKGIRASKRGKCVYTPRGFYKFYRLLAKLLPHSLLLYASKT